MSTSSPTPNNSFLSETWLLDPRCARVSLSGKFAIVTDEDELEFARNALYERHPTMTSWPDDHSWKIHKLVMDEIWLIDIFGGQYMK
jgi:hypothetical protein